MARIDEGIRIVERSERPRVEFEVCILFSLICSSHLAHLFDSRARRQRVFSVRVSRN